MPGLRGSGILSGSVENVKAVSKFVSLVGRRRQEVESQSGFRPFRLVTSAAEMGKTLPAILGLVFGLAITAGCASSGKLAGETPYRHPLNSPGTKFSGLPLVVQNTVRAEAGTTEIVDIVKSTFTGSPVYVVYFRNGELYPPLHVGEDGSVLNPDLSVAVGAPAEDIGVISGTVASGMKVSDLPKKVVETIQTRAPVTEVLLVNKEDHGAKAYYEIRFKDPSRHPALFVLDDGTILSEVPE
jgi:hypothetical protein